MLYARCDERLFQEGVCEPNAVGLISLALRTPSKSTGSSTLGGGRRRAVTLPLSAKKTPRMARLLPFRIHLWFFLISRQVFEFQAGHLPLRDDDRLIRNPF